MRFKVGIEFDESLELPFNYNKILQGFIYRNIMDKDLARFIHDRGFSYEKRKYKMFTFSITHFFLSVVQSCDFHNNGKISARSHGNGKAWNIDSKYLLVSSTKPNRS